MIASLDVGCRNQASCGLAGLNPLHFQGVPSELHARQPKPWQINLLFSAKKYSLLRCNPAAWRASPTRRRRFSSPASITAISFSSCRIGTLTPDWPWRSSTARSRCSFMSSSCLRLPRATKTLTICSIAVDIVAPMLAQLQILRRFLAAAIWHNVETYLGPFG